MQKSRQVCYMQICAEDWHSVLNYFFILNLIENIHFLIFSEERRILLVFFKILKK